MKKLSIKVQITFLILFSLIVLGVITGYLGIKKSSDALIKTSYMALQAARDTKTAQINNFFNERVGDINVLAKSENIKNLVRDLIEVHEQLKVQAGENYPVGHKFAKEKIAPHEEYFQNYTKEYGYYDMFVICEKHGHVMYTQAKESDYGENLYSGKLKDSGLAEIWRKVKEKKKATFVDMRPYAPSNGAPAMFLGTPVYIDGVIKSVLVLQISDKSINKIMTFREGYGESQEDYLVGSDNLMRSDSYLDPKRHSLIASFKNPQTGSINTEASRDALKGQKGQKVVIDYNNNPVLSVYGSIKIGEDINWAIMSEIDEAEVMIVPNTIRNNIAIAIIISLSIITFITTYIFKIGVNVPLQNFKESMLTISKNKNLTLKVDTNAPKEIAEISSSFNELMNSLKSIIDQTKSSSAENSSISHELSTTSLEVGKNVEQSVEIISEANEKTEIIKNEILQAIKDANKSKEEIINANKVLNEAREEIVNLTSKVQASTQSEIELAQEIERLFK